MKKRIISFLTAVSVLMLSLFVPSSQVLVQAEGTQGIVWGTPQEDRGVGENKWIGDMNQIHGMVYGGGKFVVPAGYIVGTVHYSKIFTSTDGVNWESPSIAGTGTKGLLQDVAYNGSGTFVAVGNSVSPSLLPTVIVSTDNGLSWSSNNVQFLNGEGNYTFSDAHNFRCVIWDGVKFIAGSQRGNIFTSTDGFNWTFAGNAAANIGDIAVKESMSGEKLYVAVGRINSTSKGRVFMSNNAVNWTDCTPGADVYSQFNGVSYGNEKFIVVGDNGVILSSENGTNWTEVATGGAHLYDVRYLNSQFIAVGASGKVLVSSDGTAWTDNSITGLVKPLWGIAYDGNGTYITGGDGGVIVSTIRARLTVSPAGLTEAEANDGSLTSGVITVNLVDADLAETIAKEDVQLTGLPEGLDYTVERVNTKQIHVNLVGNAVDHERTDSTRITIKIKEFNGSNERIIIRDGADLSTGDLITGHITIDFTDAVVGAQMSATPSVIEEAPANNGSITQRTIVLDLENAVFDKSIQKQDITITGLPAGIDFSISHMNETAGDIIWNFDNDGDFAGWASSGDMGTNVRVEAGKFKASPIEQRFEDLIYSDPYMYNANINIDAATKKFIEIRMKNDTLSNAGQIFWHDTNFDMNTVFETIPNSDFTIYTIDFTSDPRWSSSINFFRVDPGWKPGDIEIDFIRVTSAPLVDSDKIKINLTGNAINHTALNNTTATISVNGSKIKRLPGDMSTANVSCDVEFRFNDPAPVSPTPTPTVPVFVPTPTPAPLVVSDAEIGKSTEQLETAKTAKDAELAINHALKLFAAISEKAGSSSAQEKTKLLEDSLKLVNSSSAAIALLRNDAEAVNTALSIVDSLKVIVKNAETSGISADALINGLKDMCQEVVDGIGTQRIRLSSKGTTANININKLVADQIQKKIGSSAEAARKLNEGLKNIDKDAEVAAVIKIDTALNTDITKATLKLPSDLVLAAKTAELDGFIVNMGNSEVKIPVDAISVKKGENVVLTARITSPRLLDIKSRAAVGDTMVFNYNLKVGSKAVSEFKTLVEISIPYTPTENEKVEKLTVFNVNRGSLENMKAVYNKDEGVMTFSTDKFGRFVVMEAK